MSAVRASGRTRSRGRGCRSAIALTGEALLGYGNWSRVGSKHVSDQLALASQKKMRPILRTREAIERNLESRMTF